MATGSMDHTAILWDVSNGQMVSRLKGHTGEIVSLSFNSDGDKIVTGSFDHTARIWDYQGQCLFVLS